MCVCGVCCVCVQLEEHAGNEESAGNEKRGADAGGGRGARGRVDGGVRGARRVRARCGARAVTRLWPSVAARCWGARARVGVRARGVCISYL